MATPPRSAPPARQRLALGHRASPEQQSSELMSVAVAAMACLGAVLVAWTLGARWLGASVLGIPLGLWLAALGTPLFVNVVKHRSRVIPVERLRRLREMVWPRTWPAEGPASYAWNALADRAETITSFLNDRGWGDTAARWLASTTWPTRPITIGLRVPEGLAEAIVSSPSSAARRVDWVRMDPTVDDAAPAPDWLDAFVRVDNGRVIIECPERDGHDAAWFDWARPRPLTLASIFAFRVDPARVTIDALFNDRGPGAEDVRVLRDLIEAAAVFSRLPERLSLPDLLAGRRPLPAHPARPAGGDSSPARATRWHECEIMRALGESLRRHAGHDSAVMRIAARVVSAWAAHDTVPGADDRVIDDAERVRLASLAAVCLGDEPEPDLRLGALRLCTGEDDAAFAALLDAERVLRDRFATRDSAAPPPAFDQSALLNAYITYGADEEHTLGRVAAGIVLLSANTPTDRLTFMRDDLIDEFRYAGWLVGRDNDEFVLRKLFREIENARDHEPVASIGETDSTERIAA